MNEDDEQLPLIDDGNLKYFDIEDKDLMPLDAATIKLLDSIPPPEVITVSGKLRHGSLRHLVIKRTKIKKRKVQDNEHLEGLPIPDPPGILWTSSARAVMSPSRFRAVWEPHLADMQHEHAECLKRGDLRGARMAVIRAHFYSIPSWIWGIAGQVLAGVAKWLSKA